MTATKTQEAFNHAIQLHRSGRLQEAEQNYRKILRRQPADADVLHMLGVLAWQTDRHEVAANLIRQAVARRPAFPEAFYNLANALRDQGQRNEAIAAYRKAIELKPGFLEAHCNLGVLLAETGQPDEAIAAHRYTLALRPDFADAWYNLGDALSLKGQLEEAIAAFGQAIAINPKLQAACIKLSLALCARGRFDEAIGICRQAIAVQPDAVACYCALANALTKKGLLDEAVNVYGQAIARDGNCVAAHRGLAQTLEIHGDIPGAIAALKAAHKRAGGLVSYDFELAALGVGGVPSSSPPNYVIGLFNDYAGHFDQHLRQLQYAGPQLLFDAVCAALTRQPIDIMDLGCGTGLCGQLFRPMARQLTGIDLAPRMIQKARQRGVYDYLKEQHVTVALQEKSRNFDLVLAADVFIYVGRLDEVFEAAVTALRPGGLLAFTIESAESGEYALRHSRRYAHSVAYIRRLTSHCGFTEVSIQDAVLRTEHNQPVEAKVIVLRSADNGS